MSLETQDNEAVERNALVFKRGQIKAQLTRFKTSLSRLREDSSSVELIARLSNIEGTILAKFNEIQDALETITQEIQEDERTAFENTYYETIAEAKILIASMDPTPQDNDSTSSSRHSGNHNVNNNNRNTLDRVILPRLNLPEFYGSYSTWISFRDSFNSLINNSSQLGNIDKFYYLKSCLKGEAAQVIQSLEVTNDNYSIAWDMLQDRYENNKLIIHTHVKNIFELQPVKNEVNNSQLRKLLDTFNKSLRALEAIGQPTKEWDTLLIYILMSKLDDVTKTKFEESIVKKEYPTLIELTEFISNRCQVLESIENKGNKTVGIYNKEKRFTHLSTNKISCAFCNEAHFNFACDKFAKLTLDERRSEMYKHKLCSNCLRPGHFQRECKSRPCKYCKSKHHSLLHDFKNSSFPEKHDTGDNSATVTSLEDKNEQASTASTADHPLQSCHAADVTTNSPKMTACTSTTTQVILATAKVHLVDNDGKLVPCRALLDGGSMSNFITNSLAARLKLKTFNVNIPVAGINNSLSNISKKLETTVISRNKKYKTKESFLVVNKITGDLPQVTFDISSLQLPNNIELADDNFNQAGAIDILLGASVFFDILCVGQIKTGRNNPILQKTKLGWLISGNVNTHAKSAVVCNLTISNETLHNELEAFWKLEEVSNKKSQFTREENECETHFKNTFKHDATGRLVVSLPFKDNYCDLGDSEEIATKQFLSLENRLQKNESFKQRYVNFMREYENLGHMSVIDKSCDKPTPTTKICYLPHHGVLKESSTTTKIRVVFNASMKTSSDLSLNDVLKVGPVLQRDLFSVVLKFRKHNIVMTADIEKMYRQVLVAEQDRDYQRIIWRENPNDELKYYKLNTITYGTGPASFLAVRALFQAAIEYEHIYPNAAEIIKTDFYMDDLITGSESTEDAIVLKNQITEILNAACFPLRKWCSNEPKLLERGVNASENHVMLGDEEVKTLGLVWKPNSDTLSYSVNLKPSERITKRTILSTVAKIFDPLGLINPVTVKAKLILQNLWQQQFDWDESVSHELHTTWKHFQDNLPLLNSVCAPRQVTVPNAVEYQLLGFCDASEKALGACIYVRTTDANGNSFSRLLCSKSRVAPLKIVSLPRLELCGAVLLVELIKKVEQSLDLKFSKRVLWCDSTIVLSWIATEPATLKTFVANRITTIQEMSDASEWKHIRSNLNPADILSRGVLPLELLNCKLWWHGPEFLTKNSEYWPDHRVDIIEVPEKRLLKQVNCLSFTDYSIIERFSCFHKLQRVTAFVLRFINNSNPKKLKLTGDLTTNELNQALYLLVKMVQDISLNLEINCLRKKRPLPKSSKILSLNPFLDKNGLLRVGGRITNSTISYDQKHPLLLPSNHNFTRMIIESEHKRLLHAGVELTLASVRRRFWPIHGKNTVKGVIHKCLTCFRTNPAIEVARMGDLPKSRLAPARPFSSVGIDFAGPIMIKDSTLRNKKLIKSYICIFICFVTKAIHIELTTDLTTDTFLNCFKRFVARRGLCKNVYTDNGTNFCGAKNKLNEGIIWVNSHIKEIEIRNYLLNNEITWHFIPPRSPHHGGLWEAAVKSTKSHLSRVVGDARLTYEQLYTVLCQIEGILNSRPLTPLSTDPNDIAALTPGHFLIGDSLTAIPERYPNDVPVNRLKLYAKLQTIVRHFWRRWSSEYLNCLQQRTKWKTDGPTSARIGSLVILKEDNVPVLQWRTGRIIATHPGLDNVVRVVSVKTSTGTVKRSVTKICVLPIEA